MIDYVELSPKDWPANSTMQVCQVPWDGTYKDVVQFDSAQARDDYFDNRIVDKVTITDNTPIHPGEPILMPIPYNYLQRSNYIVVKSGEKPVNRDQPMEFYYFITDLRYDSGAGTWADIQLDVWMTYHLYLTPGYGYVDRGHIGIANSNSTANPSSLRQYLDIPEGLDTGSQFANVGQYYDNFGSAGWTAIMAITSDLTKSPGDKNNPSPASSSGTIADNLPNGANIYAFNTGLDLVQAINAISSKGWIGRNMQSLTIVPTKFIVRGTTQSLHPDFTPGEGVTMFTPSSGSLDISAGDVISWLENALPSRYRYLLKFLTYPYSVVSASNQAGSTTIYKPQFLATRQAVWRTAAVVIAPFTRISAFLVGYNAQGSSEVHASGSDPSGLTTTSTTVDSGDWMDNPITWDDWPQFSIANDSYSIILASSAHQRAYSYDAAGWARDKAQLSNDQGYMQNSRDISNARANRGLNMAGDAVRTAAGLGSAGLGGLALHAMDQGINFATSERNFNAAQHTADENHDLANRFIRGDNEMAIKAINATVQDASITPPAIAGATGGMGFNLKNGLIGLRVTAKMLSTGAMASVGEYWLRYGYAVRRTMRIPNRLVCMTRFAYWRVQDMYIRMSAGSETDRQTIRAIFAKGVTVWRNPDDIGLVDPGDNTPVSGYAY